MNIKDSTDKEILLLCQADTPLNKARKAFASWSAQIDQGGRQRTPMAPITVRRLEFLAVIAIAKELGVAL